MIKKIICILFFLILILPLSAFGLVRSDEEAAVKINQLESLVNYDFFDLFNKSELIGMNLTNYNISTSQYKQSAMSTIELIRSSISQVQMVRNSIDLTDEDKLLQINKLYQDIDAALYSLDSQTLNYMYSLRMIMPTITYQRFVKSFQTYYNSLDLTNNKMV